MKRILLFILLMMSYGHGVKACHATDLLSISGSYDAGTGIITADGSHDFDVSFGGATGSVCDTECDGFNMHLLVFCQGSVTAGCGGVTLASAVTSVALDDGAGGPPFCFPPYGPAPTGTVQTLAFPTINFDTNTLGLCPGVTYEMGLIEETLGASASGSAGTGTAGFNTTFQSLGTFTTAGTAPTITVVAPTYIYTTSMGAACETSDMGTDCAFVDPADFTVSGGCTSDPNGLAPCYTSTLAAGTCLPAGTYTETFTEECSGASLAVMFTVIEVSTPITSSDCPAGTVWVEADCACIAPLLPISLISLTAKAMDRVNVIEWETAEEVNSEWQIIEKSENGLSRWEEVGRLKSLNTSENQLYNLIDEEPFKRTYYRLKSIDFDGTTEYSNVITVRRTDDVATPISFRPNPVDNQGFIDIDLDRDTMLDIEVFNIVGERVSYMKADLAKGVNNIPIDFNKFESGIYFVRTNINGKPHTIKVIKN